jgi:hypothetical protein
MKFNFTQLTFQLRFDLETVNERNAMDLKSGYSRPQHVKEFISHLQVDLYYWNRDRHGT